MDLNSISLADVAFDAAADGIEPPSTLRARVLDTIDVAGHAPMPGAWADTTVSEQTNAVLAFVRTAAELSELLADLAPDEWEKHTVTPAGSVRGLAIHLLGIERYALGQLGRRPALDAPNRADHFPISRSAARDADQLTNDEIARAWWLEALEVTRACAELGPSAPVTLHHLPADVRGFLIVRTFELWTHGDDIRRANGRRLSSLDADRLALMSNGLVDVLALGMAFEGTEQPGRTARITLTGPGGGTFDIALAAGEPIGAPDTSVTMSVLDLCRVAARRLPIESAYMTVEGDHSLVEPMLAGAQAFAAD